MLLTESSAVREALARVRVLYTDLDGTLLARGGSILADGDGAPSARTAETIVALNQARLEVVPISGRNRKQLHELVRLLGWDSYIAEAGAILVRSGETGNEIVYNCGQWPEGLLGDHTPHDLIVASGAYERLTEAFPRGFEYHAPWHTGREATLILRGGIPAEQAQLVLDSLEPPVDILDNGIVRNRGDLGLPPGAHPHAYHVVPRGVNKAQAIGLDLAARGLTPDEAAAIGDSATDLAMADAVGTMVLVANALESPGVCQALESHPRDNVYITAGSRGDGWSEFSRQWLSAIDR